MIIQNSLKLLQELGLIEEYIKEVQQLAKRELSEEEFKILLSQIPSQKALFRE